jgi:hypothetical protein
MTHFRNNSSLSQRLLIIYMIGALLFLFSTHLHIHSKKSSLTSEHGAAVSISSLVNDVIKADMTGQIQVSPDGLLKHEPQRLKLLAVFILLALVTFSIPETYLRRFSDTGQRPAPRPDFCTPLLRAPPR